MAIDQLAEIKSQMGIESLEALHNFFCFHVTGGKNDGFSQLIAAINFQTVFHQIIQHHIDGAQINIFSSAYGSSINNSTTIINRLVAGITAGKRIFKIFLFLVAQFIIMNASA